MPGLNTLNMRQGSAPVELDDEELEMCAGTAAALGDNDGGDGGSAKTAHSPAADFDPSCGYPGCKYVSRNKADLANHRRRKGHPKQPGSGDSNSKATPTRRDSKKISSPDAATVDDDAADADLMAVDMSAMEAEVTDEIDVDEDKEKKESSSAEAVSQEW